MNSQLDQLTKKGGLKRYNVKGLEFKFKVKSSGHTIQGFKNKGNIKYEGMWFGNKIKKNLNVNGIRNVSVIRDQELAGQKFNLKFDYQSLKGVDPFGKINLSLGHTFERKSDCGTCFKLKQKHKINLDLSSLGNQFFSEIKLDQGKQILEEAEGQEKQKLEGQGIQIKDKQEQGQDKSKQLEGQGNQIQDKEEQGKQKQNQEEEPDNLLPSWFQGIDHTFTFTDGSENFGIQGEFTTFKPNSDIFQAKRIAGWSKIGNHSFLVDTKWKKGFELDKLQFYSQTKLDDNWKVAMMMQPELNLGKRFTQKNSLLEFGLHGKVCDHADVSILADNKRNATISGIYHPNKNVDLVVTNKFKFNEDYSLNKKSFKPAFTLSVKN